MQTSRLLQLQVMIWAGTPADISSSQKNNLVLVLQETIIAIVLTSPTEKKKYLVAAIFRASTGQPGVDLFRAEGGWRLVKKCVRHSFSPSLRKKKKEKKYLGVLLSPGQIYQSFLFLYNF